MAGSKRRRRYWPSGKKESSSSCKKETLGTAATIEEQSLEWRSPLYINFIDYEKAFGSVDREKMRKLLR